jgi:hypothetical protein
LVEIHCEDYSKDGKLIRKGCGALLRWRTDAEKASSGKKSPVNIDGSEHEHTGSGKPAKPISEIAIDAAKKVLEANESWVRAIVVEEVAKEFKKRGMGIDA